MSNPTIIGGGNLDDMPPQLKRALFAALGGKGNEDAAPLPEAQIMEMRERADDYWATMQGERSFKPGDLVVPRAGYHTRWEDRPHIVLEMMKAEDVKPIPGPDASSSGYGMRTDMRVMVYTDSGYSCFWVESWQYVEYDED